MNLDRELILSCVEEDNIQRAYFRVHPLLTISGSVVEEAAQRWPDEGCLRIVPDRAEQHTFKERMRAMGGWCVVDLTVFPPEANKIRTNKNYHPDRGEINQFILYSDAVLSAPPCVFYEVLDGTAEAFGELAAEAITPRFFIRADDTLFGPVDKAQPALPGPAPEAEAMLYSINDLSGKAHTILCIASEMDDRPKPVLRAPAAKNGSQPAAKQEEAAAPAEAPAKPAGKEKPAEPAPKSAHHEKQAEHPAAPASEKAAPAADEALPIGQQPVRDLKGHGMLRSTRRDCNRLPIFPLQNADIGRTSKNTDNIFSNIHSPAFRRNCHSQVHNSSRIHVGIPLPSDS